MTTNVKSAGKLGTTKSVASPSKDKAKLKSATPTMVEELNHNKAVAKQEEREGVVII